MSPAYAGRLMHASLGVRVDRASFAAVPRALRVLDTGTSNFVALLDRRSEEGR
jgi:hypothetical protein